MRLARQKDASTRFRRRGFTLIEIVVALTIMAVIAAVAIPTMKGLLREEKAAAPLRELAALVQEIRGKAMAEHRPYQIVFEREAIHACEYTSIVKRDEFLKHLEELREPPEKDKFERQEIAVAEVAREEIASAEAKTALNGQPLPPSAPKPKKDGEEPEMPWTKTIALEPETECAVLMWGDMEWDVIEGDDLCRWVMQPSGIASPARVRLRLEDKEMETSFDALTGEVRRERIGSRSQDP